KKEKVFHPDSRKAGQLARNALRKGKLGNLRTKRTKKVSSLLELYAFFHAALPPAPEPDAGADAGADPTEVLALPELHAIARAWVARNDGALAEEQAARRKGRPKSAREVRIEELRLREQETYRTGMELPDLTDAPTLARFRKWDVTSIGYAHLLRFVRISSALPEVLVLSR
ncbi:translation machinery-associated protein 16, partial [Mycena capillaripes]